jgi:hypothetical protein
MTIDAPFSATPCILEPFDPFEMMNRAIRFYSLRRSRRWLTSTMDHPRWHLQQDPDVERSVKGRASLTTSGLRGTNLTSWGATQ